jgi:hypothetical protein
MKFGLKGLILKLINRNAYENYLTKKVNYDFQSVYDVRSGLNCIFKPTEEKVIEYVPSNSISTAGSYVRIESSQRG